MGRVGCDHTHLQVVTIQLYIMGCSGSKTDNISTTTPQTQSNDGPIEDLTPTAPAMDTDAKMEEFPGAPETEPPPPEPINFSPEAVTVPDAGGIPVAAVAIREEE